MASRPGAFVSLMPKCSPWSECESGVSFEDWVVKIFKLRGASDPLVQDVKRFLDKPEEMKQADEVVLAFGARKGGTNARLKPKSAINECAITLAKPGSQLARLAIRRCWLSSLGSSATEELIFPEDRLIGWHGDQPEILLVPLIEPLVYGESSRNDPQRPVPSAASRVFGCDADREQVLALCRQRCASMVDAQQAAYRTIHGSHSVKRSRSTRFQHKTTCETLARLVEASLDPMELEAKASPSTKFVIGNGRVQPTSPDEIVKARCSCVDGSAFPEWLATNCRGLDYLSFAPNTFFEEEEAIIHCLVHATKALLLTSLQHCQITEADVMLGKADQDDPSVLRIAASLAAWSKSQKGQKSVSDDADVIDSESDLENGDKFDSGWDSTDKHRVLFVIKKTEMQKLVGPESAQACRNMWRRGHLRFVLSAPRACYARWRMKVAPSLPDSEHGLEAQPELLFGILLPWVGNTFFAHEALRRSPIRGVGVLRDLFKIGMLEQSKPMPSASCTEPMPSDSESASPEPSCATHSATEVPSSSSSDSSEGPGRRRRGPRHLLARPSAAPEPRNYTNVWKQIIETPTHMQSPMLHQLLTGQRAVCLADDQRDVMRHILTSEKPLLYVSALAGTGKSVVLGLLMDLMLSDDRHVIVLVPSRVLRDETVITHCQDAGLTEHDERILWLGRPPSNTNGDSIGIFADQLEERATEKLEALSKLKGIETTLRELHMELIHHKICKKDWREVLPFSTCWSRSCQPEPGSGRRVTATWLTTSTAYRPLLKYVHELKKQLKAHMTVLMSELVKKRPQKYAELLSKVKCIVATTDAFLKWKAGQTKGMIGRTVAKVAARSEGALVDEVEALDVLPAVAALNEHFKTCIFVGDENQTFLNQRRGQSPEQIPLVSGRAHGAASNLKKRKISESDDVKNEVELVDEEEDSDSEEEFRANNGRLRGISDWLRTDNENIEHVSGLNQCKRCGPAITEFLSSLLTPMRQQLSRFQSSSMAPPTRLHHIIYAGSGWWSWEELCNYERTAANRARERKRSDAWQVWYSASNATNEHVVWHEMLFRHLLVQVDWELRNEMQAGEKMLIICFLRRVSEPITALLAAFLSEEEAKRVDVVLLDSARGLTADRVHVIYSSRFVGRYDQFLGIQADPNRLYVAYTRGRLATTVWMEREPLGCPNEECWEGWMPTFNNHPAKSASSRTTQQWIQFAGRRLALLHRGEVAEPAGSAHSAPTEFHHRRHRRHRRHRKNPTYTWEALRGTTREDFDHSYYGERFSAYLNQACEVARKKLTSARPAGSCSAPASLASIADRVVRSEVLDAPMASVREVGIGKWMQKHPLPPKPPSVDPTEEIPMWLHKAIKFAMLVPNAVAISLGDKGRVQLSVPYAILPGVLVEEVAETQSENHLDHDVVGFGAIMWILHEMWLKHTDARSPTLRQSREEGLKFEILRHKAELKEDKEGCTWFQKSCHSDRFAVSYIDPNKGRKGRKRLYLYRGGGSLDTHQTPLVGGLVVRSETQFFAAMALVTLHFLSGCSPACEELVGFVKECLVVDEELYVDPEGTEDLEDAQLFAQRQEEATSQHCRNFKALYEDILANVMECLESQAGLKWPGRDIHDARSREAFLYAALGQHK